MSVMEMVAIDASPALEAIVAPYTSAYPLVDACAEIASTYRKLPARDVSFLAVDIQIRQNEADAEWVRQLDLPAEVRLAINARLQARGACWLELVERLVQYEGDYRDH